MSDKLILIMPWAQFEQDEGGEDGNWGYQFERFDRWISWHLRPEAVLKDSELPNIIADLGCFEKIDLYNLIEQACEETLKLNAPEGGLK